MATNDKELTPMQRQYRTIKENNQDCILFFRLGDFYEMFDEDARVASAELDLTLTTRDRGKPKEEQTPMCGVPYHSVDAYIARLVQKGYKVAICEQMQDPATTKGLVERDITRIVTPGTVTESCMLEESRNNYYACLFGGEKFGLAFCDISTGAFYATVCTDPQTAVSELGRFSPAEVLRFGKGVNTDIFDDCLLRRLSCCVNEGKAAQFDPDAAEDVLQRHFARDLAELGLANLPEAVLACGTLLQTLKTLQKKRSCPHPHPGILHHRPLYGAGSGCPAQSGADRNHALQGKNGQPAVGAGQDPHRHGQPDAALLAGKAAAGSR